MSFTSGQLNALTADLNRKNVRTRPQGGRQLSYIEGWHAIAEANRIFGFDSWQSETVFMQMVCSGERQSNGRALQTCTYVARCRLTVVAGDQTIVREGFGAGHGMDQDAGQAHEKAVKEAETDARKRALMTFGNQFGLALYDKDQANVTDAEEPAAPAPGSMTPREINEALSEPAKDIKVVALERAAAAMKAKPSISARAQAVKPKTQAGPTIGDSAGIRAMILLGIEKCQTSAQLEEHADKYGRQSPTWPLMLKPDQDIILKAAVDRLRAIKAKPSKGATA